LSGLAKALEIMKSNILQLGKILRPGVKKQLKVTHTAAELLTSWFMPPCPVLL
jgi:hypothetical protein